MKRCPQCNRVETDDALVFCRADGATLITDSGAVSSEAKTAKFGAAPASSEVKTTMLPHTTGASGNRGTEPTTVLPAQQSSGPTRRLGKSKLPMILIAAGAALALVVVAVVAVAVVNYSYLSRKNITNVTSIQSIAVMPFVNESGNADIEYLSEGMTETLIRTLSQLPNLNVKARSSVFRYKGKVTDAKTIGRELNVEAILNGQVVQRGDQLTLNLELIDAQTENVIWADQYNRKQTDLLSLQTEIAHDVSNKIRVKLSGEDEQKLARNYTANPEAYRLYLQGRYFWNKRGKQNLQKAIAYFEQAIAIDPNYALAYSGLVDAYASADFHLDKSKPREYALKALSLDSNLPEAHTSLGIALLHYDYDFAGAERAHRRAIELNPNSATAHQFYWLLLNVLGRRNEADAEIRRALELEPLSLPINWFYGMHLYVGRDYDASIRQLRKTIELDPGFINAQISLGDVLILKGMYQDAAEQFAKEQELDGRPENAVLIRQSFARGGWRECWRMITSDAARFDRSPYTLARMFAELGEKDKAFAELDKAYEIRQSPFLRLKVDPRLDSLRADPRFQDLVRRVGLPQ